MIHVWPDLWYTGAERGDTGHRHGGRSKYHLHTTVLYIQGPVCMSEMGPDVQLPEKRLNCHLFAIPTLLLPFFFPTASLLLRQVYSPHSLQTVLK